jgi:preprotein translocase subunit YajC
MAFILLLALFALAWIVLILPKQRELKRHNALVASLEVGDEVMTGSGFYGTLTAVDDDTVHLRLAEGLEVKLARRAVAAKVVDQPADAPATAAAISEGTDDDGGGVTPAGTDTDDEPGADGEERP